MVFHSGTLDISGISTLPILCYCFSAVCGNPRSSTYMDCFCWSFRGGERTVISRDETANNSFYRLIWNLCFNFDENDTSSFLLETSMVTCEQPSFFGRNPMLVQSGLCAALLKLLIGFDALFLSIWDPIRSPSSLMSYSRLWSSSVLVVKAKKCWGLHPLTIL